MRHGVPCPHGEAAAPAGSAILVFSEHDVEYRELGNTGVPVSSIGLGCMGLVGWYGQRDDAEARATVERAIDLGVTHFDTAAVYQNGDNERFVGELLRAHREKLFIATKCGLVHDADGLRVDNRPETLRASCDASLARLGIDCIDLFYLHRIDPAVPIEESMGAMADLVAAGKVRFVGLSEASPHTLRRAHEVYPVAALQSELSLWTRSASAPALDVCRELGIGFVAYSPLGRGFLAGQVRSREDLPEGDTRRGFPRFSAERLAENQVVRAELEALAEHFDSTPAQLALAWVLAQWRGIVAIPGTKKRIYLDDNLGALELELSSSDLDLIERRVPEGSGARYPDAMLEALDH